MNNEDYNIYTTEFDEIRDVSDAMQDMDVNYIDRLREFLDKHTDRLDTSVTGISPDAPAPVFLLDCSGSMRGSRIINSVLALRAAGDALDQAGVDFEILGFTTRTWNYGTAGFSRKAWIDAGRPQEPGRVADLLHLVIKDMDKPWAEVRDNLVYLLQEGILKDNIDGEAMSWAAARIIKRMVDIDQILVPIFDSGPEEKFTKSINSTGFLENHLESVRNLVHKTGTPVRGVFIGEKIPETGIDPVPAQVRETRGPVVFNDMNKQALIDAIYGQVGFDFERDSPLSANLLEYYRQLAANRLLSRISPGDLVPGEYSVSEISEWKTSHGGDNWTCTVLVDMNEEDLDLVKMDMVIYFASGSDRIIAALFGGSNIDNLAVIPENRDHSLNDVSNDAPGID